MGGTDTNLSLKNSLKGATVNTVDATGKVVGAAGDAAKATGHTTLGISKGAAGLGEGAGSLMQGTGRFFGAIANYGADALKRRSLRKDAKNMYKLRVLKLEQDRELEEEFGKISGPNNMTGGKRKYSKKKKHTKKKHTKRKYTKKKHTKKRKNKKTRRNR